MNKIKFGNGIAKLQKFKLMDPSILLEEFLDKVDKLCFEYGFEIWPTVEGWTGILDKNNEYPTIAIIGNDIKHRIMYIDGDGRGK